MDSDNKTSQLNYYYKNKRKILKRCKSLRSNLTEFEKQLKKEYQHKYYEKTKEYISCETCKCKILKHGLSTHLKSKKHKFNLICKNEQVKDRVKILKEKKQRRRAFLVPKDEKIYNQQIQIKYINSDYHKKLYQKKKREKQQERIKQHGKKEFDTVIVIWI
jgi:hypothetical protein